MCASLKQSMTSVQLERREFHKSLLVLCFSIMQIWTCWIQAACNFEIGLKSQILKVISVHILIELPISLSGSLLLHFISEEGSCQNMKKTLLSHRKSYFAHEIIQFMRYKLIYHKHGLINQNFNHQHFQHSYNKQ